MTDTTEVENIQKKGPPFFSSKVRMTSVFLFLQVAAAATPLFLFLVA